MAGRPSYGWKSFCGILLIVVGFFNVVDGLVAITQSNAVKSALGGAETQLALTDNVKTWGWIVLILGVVLILAGFGLFSGSGLARFIGIVAASVNAIAQLAWMPHNETRSFVMILIDVVVIYGIAVHCGRDDEALL